MTGMLLPGVSIIWLLKQDLQKDNSSQHAIVDGGNFRRLHPQAKHYRQSIAIEKESVSPIFILE